MGDPSERGVPVAGLNSEGQVDPLGGLRPAELDDCPPDVVVEVAGVLEELLRHPVHEAVEPLDIRPAPVIVGEPEVALRAILADDGAVFGRDGVFGALGPVSHGSLDTGGEELLVADDPGDEPQGPVGPHELAEHTTLFQATFHADVLDKGVREAGGVLHELHSVLLDLHGVISYWLVYVSIINQKPSDVNIKLEKLSLSKCCNLKHLGPSVRNTINTTKPVEHPGNKEKGYKAKAKCHKKQNENEHVFNIVVLLLTLIIKFVIFIFHGWLYLPATNMSFNFDRQACKSPHSRETPVRTFHK